VVEQCWAAISQRPSGPPGLREPVILLLNRPTTIHLGRKNSQKAIFPRRGNGQTPSGDGFSVIEIGRPRSAAPRPASESGAFSSWDPCFRRRGKGLLGALLLRARPSPGSPLKEKHPWAKRPIWKTNGGPQTDDAGAGQGQVKRAIRFFHRGLLIPNSAPQIMAGPRRKDGRVVKRFYRRKGRPTTFFGPQAINYAFRAIWAIVRAHTIRGRQFEYPGLSTGTRAGPIGTKIGTTPIWPKSGTAVSRRGNPERFARRTPRPPRWKRFQKGLPVAFPGDARKNEGAPVIDLSNVLWSRGKRY